MSLFNTGINDLEVEDLTVYKNVKFEGLENSSSNTLYLTLDGNTNKVSKSTLSLGNYYTKEELDTSITTKNLNVLDEWGNNDCIITVKAPYNKSSKLRLMKHNQNNAKDGFEFIFDGEMNNTLNLYSGLSLTNLSNLPNVFPE